MGKKKEATTSSPDAFKHERDEYDRKAAIAAAIEDEKRSRNETGEKPPEVLGRLDHTPIRDIDWNMFTQARIDLIQASIENRTKWPLYFFGEVGIGKTFLAAAIYEKWPIGQPLWMPYTQLCDRCERLRDGRGFTISQGVQSRDITTFEQWWAYLATLKLVVIDDFGILDDLGTADLSGDVLQSRRYRNEWMISLLDIRSNQPLVLTSNLAIENSLHNNRLKSIHEVFDRRLISRIRAGKVVELGGHDLRGRDYAMDSIV